MSNFKAFKTAQEAQAKAWSEANEHKLRDFEQADYKPAFTNDNEIQHELDGADLDTVRQTEEQHDHDIMALVTAIDVDRGYYEETENGLTAVERGGNFNVTDCAAWSAKRPEVDQCEKTARSVWGWAMTGWNGGFIPEAYDRKESRAKKARAKHNIGFCYHESNGKVRAKLKSDDQTNSEKAERVVTLANILDDLAL